MVWGRRCWVLIALAPVTEALLQVRREHPPTLRSEWWSWQVHTRLATAILNKAKADAIQQREALLAEASGGRMSEVDAEIYAIQSLDALKAIALTRPRAYNIVDAEPALIEAIADRGDTTRLMVAEILSKIDSATAQRALLVSALASNAGDDRIPLLDYAAASVRRFGDYATDAQAAELTQMIKNSSGEEADAAARLNGALNRASSMMPSSSANQGN